jgi:hypothetical protein
MASLRPFFALPHVELQKRLAEAEQLPETFTLIVKGAQAGKAGKSAKGGKVVLQWNDAYSRDTWWNTRPRADAQINLMEPFLDRLTEDMRCVGLQRPRAMAVVGSRLTLAALPARAAGSLSPSMTSPGSSSLTGADRSLKVSPSGSELVS